MGPAGPSCSANGWPCQRRNKCGQTHEDLAFTEGYRRMKRPPNLKTAMTPFPYSVELDVPIEQARELMEQHSVHHLPVTDGRILVGLITNRDIKANFTPRSEPDNTRCLKVRDLYVSEAYIVDLNEPIDNVLLTMAEKHVDSAIVTREGKLAGVFTSMDACRCFGAYLRKNFPRANGDEVA